MVEGLHDQYLAKVNVIRTIRFHLQVFVVSTSSQFQILAMKSSCELVTKNVVQINEIPNFPHGYQTDASFHSSKKNFQNYSFYMRCKWNLVLKMWNCEKESKDEFNRRCRFAKSISFVTFSFALLLSLDITNST